MSHVIVTDAVGETWPAFLQPLADWLLARGSERYVLRWRPQTVEARGLGLFALPHVVPPAVMADLSAGNTVIVPHLLASISGTPVYREHNILDELVRRSLALVIDRNLAASSDRYGSPQYGSHLERYLVDALQRLARGNSAWAVNREKSRVWLGQDGLFLVWPGAAEDVQHLLEADQLAGIPKAPETMLELLLAAGVFEAATAGRSIWSIQPPGAKTPLEAVKLSAPAILLAGIHPPPVGLPQALEFKPEQARAPVTPQAPALVSTQVPMKNGTQLSLIPPPEPPVCNETPVVVAAVETPASPSLEAAPISPSPSFGLQAPMRLNPVVRDALADAVCTLNDGMGPASVCTVAQGVFVPLEEFVRRGVPPSAAMRALTETKMLVKPNQDGPPTLSREFNGNPTVGIVINPHFVSGLDLAGFAVPSAEQN